MLASAVALGLFAGLAFGGNVRRLRTFALSWLPLLVVSVGTRLAAPLAGDLAIVAYLAAFIGIAAVAARNGATLGMPLIAAGAALNVLAVALNGAMPVSEDALRSAAASMPADRLHAPFGTEPRFVFLADVIAVPPLHAVYSLGDVLIALGGAAVAFRSVRA